jgi:hypothetical protein
MADNRPRIRPLTAAERALVASVFGDSVAPDSVTIRCAKFWALHPWWVTMAPDGHIWCHPNGFDWVPDYARQPLGMQEHFVHEMVHVWQVQQRGSLVWRRPPFARYRYDLAHGKNFSRYGIEQQACIVADAFRLRAGQTLPGKPELAAYRGLIPFGDWE